MTISTLFLLMFMSSLLSLLIHSHQLLMSLLSLEMVFLVSVTMFILELGTSSQFNLLMVILILTFAACEASMGLTLMVKLLRSSGSDSIKTLSSNKC
uniref:NADH-ubiquinone oxidoreductase chain 4L n=1 Tax=Osedax rubiplumus TaxID=283784 RepID=A0A6M4ALA7_OSERU|nr:NADH dehydrogenase subunit 4L [Osedax rubiplumus]QJQ26880.1 NADH dehydrogenase subunit 4L [Osedax rubiplumus]